MLRSSLSGCSLGVIKISSCWKTISWSHFVSKSLICTRVGRVIGGGDEGGWQVVRNTGMQVCLVVKRQASLAPGTVLDLWNDVFCYSGSWKIGPRLTLLSLQLTLLLVIRSPQGKPPQCTLESRAVLVVQGTAWHIGDPLAGSQELPGWAGSAASRCTALHVLGSGHAHL